MANKVKKIIWFIKGHLIWKKGSEWNKINVSKQDVPWNMWLCAYDFWKYFSNENGG